MKRFARMHANSVAEIFEAPDDADIADLFHADVIAALLPVSGEVAVGMIRHEDGRIALPLPEGTGIKQVKAEAGRRILARYPQWKQANMTARFIELMRKGEANLTPEEGSEALAIQNAWLWIGQVRNASNLIEARLSAEPFLDPTQQPEWPQQETQ